MIRLLSALFHMDMFPRIPKSFLLELIKLSKMDCNATPIDISKIEAQLQTYDPPTSRIGSRNDVSSILWKTFFIVAVLTGMFTMFMDCIPIWSNTLVIIRAINKNSSQSHESSVHFTIYLNYVVVCS